MNWLCRWFGHKPPCYAARGWYSPGEQYGRLTNGYPDGTGRLHAKVIGECARCGKDFMLARVHIPQAQDVQEGKP